MSNNMSNFSEIELIKTNIIIIAILLSILEFSSKYDINKPIISTSFLGLLISIISLYLFHMEKIDNNKPKVLVLNYSSIIYVNILSLVYLILSFNFRNYTRQNINVSKSIENIYSGLKLPQIEVNMADLLIVLLPLILLIVSTKIFKTKNSAFKDRYNIKHFGSIITIFVIKCLLYTTVLISWYYFSSNILLI